MESCCRCCSMTPLPSTHSIIWQRVTLRTFATAVPDPMAMPMSAFFSAGASFTPSPVIATCRGTAMRWGGRESCDVRAAMRWGGRENGESIADLNVHSLWLSRAVVRGLRRGWI